LDLVFNTLLTLNESVKFVTGVCFFFLINFLLVNRLRLIFAIHAFNKICWLLGRWKVGSIVSSSLDADIGFLVDTGDQPLECEQ
jgi:hypothetical protein